MILTLTIVSQCSLERNGTEVSEGIFTLASLEDDVVFRAALVSRDTTAT